MLEYGLKLKIFLMQKGVRQKDFAKELKVSGTTVSDSWLKRNVKPQEHHARRINEYTEGAITMGELGYE